MVYRKAYEASNLKDGVQLPAGVLKWINRFVLIVKKKMHYIHHVLYQDIVGIVDFVEKVYLKKEYLEL